MASQTSQDPVLDDFRFATIRPELLPLWKSRFLVHSIEIDIRVANRSFGTFRKTAVPTIRGVLRAAPCPGHPANRTYRFKEARHLK